MRHEGHLCDLAREPEVYFFLQPALLSALSQGESKLYVVHMTFIGPRASNPQGPKNLMAYCVPYLAERGVE